MRKLKILADPASLMKNITKFFTNEKAYIQELLQNARRAEASRVSVDISESKITVKDNGHGVYDPQRLITIGGSEWKSKVGHEVPAGMGLFSSFKAADRIEIRSADWCLDLYYNRLIEGTEPTLQEDMEVIKGTEITLHMNTKLGHTQVGRGNTGSAYRASEAEEMARQWVETASYMPFETVITIEDGRNPNNPTTTFDPWDVRTYAGQSVMSIPKFTLDKTDPATACVDFEWGCIQVGLRKRTRRKVPRRGEYLNDFISVVSQGVSIDEYKPNMPNDISMIVHVNAGELDLRLPDRDSIIKNDRSKTILKEADQGISDALVKLLNDGDWSDKENAALAQALLNIDTTKEKMLEVTPDKRAIRINHLNEDRIVKNRVLTVKEARRIDPILFHLTEDLKVLSRFSIRPIFQIEGLDTIPIKAFIEAYPEAEIYEGIELKVHNDPRDKSETHVYIVDSLVAVDRHGSTHHIEPARNEVILINYEDVDDVDNIVSQEDHDWNMVLLHTSPDTVPEEPSMDVWHNQDIDGANHDEVWKSHPINIFLLTCDCDTIITEGPPQTVDASIKNFIGDTRYTLEDCRLEIDSEGCIKLIQGVLRCGSKVWTFKNDEGKAEIENA